MSKKRKNISCEFVEWIIDKGYMCAWEDFDNDGLTWVNHKEDKMHLDFDVANKFTIEEIYSYFLIDTNRV